MKFLAFLFFTCFEVQKLFRNFQRLRYMTRCVRHFHIEFDAALSGVADEDTCRFEASVDSFDFSLTKRLL